MKKSAISTVVATVLIVLITVAAISILWIGISPMLKVDVNDYDSGLSIVTGEDYTFYDPGEAVLGDETVVVQVAVTGEDVPDYIQIILTMSDGKDLISVHDSPGYNEKMIYYLDLSGEIVMPTYFPEYVSVAPIYVSDGSNVLGVRIPRVKLPWRVEDDNFYDTFGTPVAPVGVHVSGGGGSGDSGLGQYASEDSEVPGETVTQISDCVELQNMNDDLDADYKLVDNIDCSDVDFSPVGSESSPFSGSFDGSNKIISDLYINKPGSDYVGLFGYSQGESDFLNVRLEGVNINGKNYVGGLIGYAGYTASVTHCSVSGEINGVDIVGGLIGYSGEEAFIDSCYSETEVSGVDYVGGLVGENNCRIENSYSIGEVSGADYVGGLVGSSQSESYILNSYSIEDVNGNNYVGGLSGYHRSGFSNCYSVSNIYGVDYVGGLVGENEGGSITNSFWYDGINVNVPDYCYSDIDGDQGNVGCTSIDDNVYFYSNVNDPMGLWDADVWSFSVNDYPKLS